MRALSLVTIALSAALAGCVAAQQAQLQRFETEAAAITQECRGKRLAGELSGFVASVQCSNPRLAQLAASYRIADSDVVALYLARRLEIAERMDAGKLTEAQGQVEMIRDYQEAAETQAARNRGAVEAQAEANRNLACMAAAFTAGAGPSRLPVSIGPSVAVGGTVPVIEG